MSRDNLHSHKDEKETKPTSGCKASIATFPNTKPTELNRNTSPQRKVARSNKRPPSWFSSVNVVGDGGGGGGYFNLTDQALIHSLTH